MTDKQKGALSLEYLGKHVSQGEKIPSSRLSVGWREKQSSNPKTFDLILTIHLNSEEIHKTSVNELNYLSYHCLLSRACEFKYIFAY